MKKWLILTLVLILTLSAGASAANLGLGARGDLVSQVQQRLIDLGLLSGEADGRYGEDTVKAVSAFQSANGLAVTGEVNNSTWATLSLGGRDAVTQAQQALIDAGYLNGEADGLYGTSTAQAVSAFQQAKGLTVSGFVDDATREALLGQTPAAEPTAVPEQTLTAEPTPVPEEDDGDFPLDMPIATPEPEEDLVTRAQKRLIELGFLSGKADGLWGEKSAAALKLFQRANNLAATGEADEATLAALFSQDARGDVVRQAQQRLIDLGYLRGKADGIWGEKSAAALRQFQKLQGLTVTGEMDDATQDRLFSQDVKALRPALTGGDKGDGVKALQQRLTELGFMAGKVDGSYGKVTYAAVLAFQKHLIAQGQDMDGEIAATGEATALTQEVLFSASYSSYVRDIAPGAEDDEALRVERRLRTLGYLDAEPDGVFDDYAVSALAAFRARAGLPDGSVADRAAQDAMFAADAVQAEGWVHHTVNLGDSAGVVRDAQNVLIREGFLTGLADGDFGSGFKGALSRLHGYLEDKGLATAALFADPEILSAEAQDALMSGDLIGYAEDVTAGAGYYEVCRVQLRLSGLFYMDASGVDGKCGSATSAAIQAFQAANDLAETGVADERTQAILFSDDAIGNWTPYKLEVSIADQRVYVYQLDENNVYQPIDSFICSTGLGNSTPTGVFTSTRPLDRWHYFTKFKCWAQYAYQIQGDILFHSVLFSEQDERTLREGSVYALGGKASHGCVRLKVEDARWIYNNCESGTIVVVY